MREMEICKHNQNGFCKFRERCDKRHDNEICRSRKECTDSECTKRHPRECKYFQLYGYCTFSDTCAYSHMAHKNNKVETLEKEVAELKDDVEMAKMMIESMNRMIQSKVDIEMKHKEDNEKTKREKELKEMMEKEVGDLKNELSTLKQMFAKLYTLMKANKVEAVEKINENTNENEGVTEKAKESSEKLKGAKFNCEKCEYETNKRITLKKHMNTKHGEHEE